MDPCTRLASLVQSCLINMKSLYPVLSITSKALPLVNVDNGEEIDFDITDLSLSCYCRPPVIAYVQ